MPALLHLAYPPRIANGRFVTVGQGSDGEILGCVEMILRTPEGWWDSLPGLGVEQLEFSTGAPDVAQLRRMLERYEPRVHALTDTQLKQASARIRVETARRD